MPPCVGITWPSRLEPAPKGVTGHAALARDREDARDLLRRGRVDDEVRPLRPVEGHVGRVQVALGVAVRDARVLAERLDERIAKLLDGDRHANSFSEGSPPATLSTAQRRLSWTPRSAASPSFASQSAKKAE